MPLGPMQPASTFECSRDGTDCNAVSTRSDTWCGHRVRSAARLSGGARLFDHCCQSVACMDHGYCLLVCAQSSGVPASRPRSGSAAARHGHSRGLERSAVPGSLSVEGGPGLVRRRRAAASPARWDDDKTSPLVAAARRVEGGLPCLNLAVSLKYPTRRGSPNPSRYRRLSRRAESASHES
jgi:hypothetical protein